jgi:hypothetical protein
VSKAFCHHCRLKHGHATWTLRACAEGRKKRVIRLCAACDVDLNRLVLAFANIANVDSIIARYSAVSESTDGNSTPGQTP